MFLVSYVGSNIIERQPFEINRAEGSFRYIFFHFTSKVIIKIDGEFQEAQPGSCILYTPHFPQHFYVKDNRLNHDYVDFTISDDRFFKKIRFPVNTIINPKLSSEISKYIKDTFDEHLNASLGYEYVVDSILLDMFVMISRTLHNGPTNEKVKYDKEINNKFDAIRLKIYTKPDNIEVTSLAREFGYSLSYFNYLYKKTFNVSPIEDLTKARIIRVNELIKENYPTKEIVKMIGFSSEEYFYRWFKKHNKITKSEFEAKINNK